MLTGLFHDRAAAERAYQALRSRGYTDADVSVLMSEATRRRLFGAGPDGGGSTALEGAGVGAGVGAVAGGVLGALVGSATVAIPALGLVIAGPLAAALAGAGVGGAAGGALGALVGAGVPEERARADAASLAEGAILLGVAPRSAADREFFERKWRG